MYSFKAFSKTFCELGATYEKMVEALEKVNNE